MGRRSEPHRLGPRRDPAVDEAVLDATRRSLVEVGYAATTLEGVARRAGVSRPTIYRRWPNKAMLVHEAVFPLPAPFPDGPRDLADEIALLVRGLVDFFAPEHVRAAVPGLMAELRDDPELRSCFAARLETEARRTFAVDVLAPAVEDRRARSGLDPDVVLDLLTGAVVVATCVRRVDDLDAFAAALTDVLLHGIAAVDAAHRPTLARPQE